MRLPAFLLLAASMLATPAAAQSLRDRLPEDEVLYFLLPDRFENGDTANDRGGLKGDRLVTGFDPSAKGFFHGGDLKGLIKRLDYVQALGATAIWVAPIFKNKAVQGPAGQESAGYHGYWVTDFTQVDPHFGTNADFKALVDAAHARGIKVYMDIIANHTADVIQYRECGGCDYRSRADYPYGRKGGLAGAAINPGFAGDHVQTAENFARLTHPDFAYTPFVPAAEKDVKVPAWLNDPIYYHNRGNSTFAGESSLLGDFVGLDDLFTENPRVVAGMIEIFGSWIDRFGIDGFRIDTARHVNPEFWAAFAPAMLERARAKGIPNFHIFGEVADPDVAALARHTRVDKLPAVLDFGFAMAANDVASGKAGTDRLAKLFAADVLYEGGEATAQRLPTFIGNHDAGRSSTFIKAAIPDIGQDELLARVRLAHAMLFYGLMSLAHGPLSDAWGRKRVILGGLVVFAGASVGCALSTDLPTLLAFRALQGLSAGVGMIVGRAVIRDLYHGHDAQRLMSQVSMLFGIAPAIAPIIGGWILLSGAGWPLIFWFLVVFSLVLLVATARFLPETHPPEARVPLSPRALLRDYVRIGFNPRFLRLALAGSIGFGGIFLYIASAPVFVMQHLHLGEGDFAWLFIPTIGGMTAGAFLSGRMAGHTTPTRQVTIGFSLCALSTLLNVGYVVLAPQFALPWAVLPIFLGGMGMALIFPILALAVLDMYPHQRGLASSLQAFAQLMVSTVVAGVVSPLLSASPLHLALGQAGFFAAGFVFWYWEHRRERAVQAVVTDL